VDLIKHLRDSIIQRLDFGVIRRSLLTATTVLTIVRCDLGFNLNCIRCVDIGTLLFDDAFLALFRFCCILLLSLIGEVH